VSAHDNFCGAPFLRNVLSYRLLPDIWRCFLARLPLFLAAPPDANPPTARFCLAFFSLVPFMNFRFQNHCLRGLKPIFCPFREKTPSFPFFSCKLCLLSSDSVRCPLGIGKFFFSRLISGQPAARFFVPSPASFGALSVWRTQSAVRVANESFFPELSPLLLLVVSPCILRPSFYLPS